MYTEPLSDSEWKRKNEYFTCVTIDDALKWEEFSDVGDFTLQL